MKDLAKKFNTSMKTFEGMEGEDAELLQDIQFYLHVKLRCLPEKNNY